MLFQFSMHDSKLYSAFQKRYHESCIYSISFHVFRIIFMFNLYVIHTICSRHLTWIMVASTVPLVFVIVEFPF